MAQDFFRLLPEKPNFPFVKYAKLFFGVAIVFMAICFGYLFTRGLNYGVDFQGGSEVHVKFSETVTVDAIRDALKPAGYADDAAVQTYGEASRNEFIVRVASEDLHLAQHQESFQKALDSVVGKENGALLRFSEERLYVTYDAPQDAAKIQQALASLGSEKIKVQSVAKFGRASTNEYAIQFSGAGARIVEALQQGFGKDKVEVLQIEEVGQKVGSELRTQALGAVIISIVLILLYIWFRFDFEYAPGAILALIHDAIAILGIFSIMRLQFDLSSIAAVLTIVGFSINDTIVTYDRIRENMGKLTMNFPDLINLSINETLGRTILTALSLFMACLVLYFLGGPITQNFALALCVGIVSGTFSTVFIASPLTIYIRRYMQKKSV
jgi:preprotein translocase subunit SecF